MSELNVSNFVKHHTLYHRMLYFIIMALIVLSRLLNITENSARVILIGSVFVAFFLTEVILQKLRFFDSDKICIIFRYSQIVTFGLIQAFIPSNFMVMPAICIFTAMLEVEFAVQGTDFDKSSIFVRRVMIILAAIINVGVSLISRMDSEWICYFLFQSTAIYIVFFILDWLIGQYDKYDKKINQLMLEKNEIVSDNEKLIEYQNRVKAVNEQINYQKIDLARLIRELEQVNTEVESQSEVMKYMASTFDVLKCIDVITDAIVNVKKTKICALYVDKDVYMNKNSSFIVKTNYSSMERRLKKDIDNIYQEFIQNHKTSSEIYTGSGLSRFRFIGDANITSLAILPLVDGIRSYGIMILGSDQEDFFNKGLNYYESCILEFNVAIKSTNLYLQMQDMARKDGLTGLYNRLYFKELFASTSGKCVQYDKPISVALFDIDKFKSVNDTYGHLAGDEVIKMVAHVGQKYAERYNGFACRYGGEEFLLVLPEYDEKQMLSILEEMHEEIKATTVTYNDISMHVNVCIGFSSYPNICRDVELLVSRADKAMYYGKRHGRGRLVMDNPVLDEEE